MRSPEKVLNSLTEHSKDTLYKYERLYRILFNEGMYYVAYQRIYAKEGNMTPGSDNQTIDGMSLTRIVKLIASLKDESYQPQPSRRVYIPKKNGKMRPLGVPAFDDKLVQEVVRMVLEAVYEGSFEHTSHGFRPNRSCHTALAQIQKSFIGAKWFVEGDIKGFFDNINHETLMNILSERIADERFLRLIRKFANAGYIEDWTFHKTYSGTPQGGIISPILANIYLDKLDKFMKTLIENFDKGERRKHNPESSRLGTRRWRAVSKLKTIVDEEERKKIINQIKEIDKEKIKFHFGDEMDGNYKRLKYVRYADDFLIGIIGSKRDAEVIKEKIKNYLHDNLVLELSDEKTLITHTEKNAKFLGYDITVAKTNHVRRMEGGFPRRSVNKMVNLRIPQNLIRQKLQHYDALKIVKGKKMEQWKPKSRAMLINNDDLEILSRYNAEIIGLYNFYSLAKNSSSLHAFKYIMEYSMYKTFAGKYRTSVAKICSRYQRNGIFTVSYENSKGKRKYYSLYNKGFKQLKPSKESKYDNFPNIGFTLGKTNLIDRLKAQKCELCGATGELDMHHVRKLKDLKGKKDWEKRMIARKRKTIALCQSCHNKIHSNKL